MSVCVASVCDTYNANICILFIKDILVSASVVNVAEWLRRWASDPEVDGSNPGKLLVLLHIIPVCFRCASAMMLVAGG